jgi:hypothetical protein
MRKAFGEKTRASAPPHTLGGYMVELVEGIEPTTARLQGEGSTIELHQRLQPSQDAMRNVSRLACKRLLSNSNVCDFKSVCWHEFFLKFPLDFSEQNVNLMPSRSS